MDRIEFIKYLEEVKETLLMVDEKDLTDYAREEAYNSISSAILALEDNEEYYGEIDDYDELE